MRIRENFQDIFSQYLEAAKNPAVKKSLVAAANRADFAMSEAVASDIVPQYSLQKILRPLYSKGEPQRPDIGDHPDFKHLLGTAQTVYCPITTMFMDIESSTRLSLLYPLEDVRRIKNAFIRTAMEIIKSFDGHVHRVMGDAVMAYFGGLHATPEMGVVDGLNCASILCYIVENSIIPKLKELGYETDFGIRIGLDFGKKEEVLWSSYGYPGMEEVTATSLFVDLASKLQNAAGRNQIMMGESLRSFIDFPDELLAVKTVTTDNGKQLVPYVMPNHTNKEGKPINYKQHIFEWEAYLKYSPIARYDRKLIPIGEGLIVVAEIYSDKNGIFEKQYNPCSEMLPKHKAIKFKVTLSFMPMLPYNVKFTVENHGEEARIFDSSSLGNHSETKTITSEKEHSNIYYWDYSAFRGMHYLIIEVHTHRGLQYKHLFGVFVE